ncbi:MAG: hypothetical protein ACXWC9_07980 [Pseudobdellovibrionaceae bacterium]
MRLGSIFIIGSMVANLIACGSSSDRSQPSKDPKSTSSPATASATSTTTALPQVEIRIDETACERGPEKRSIDIEPVLPTGCKLWYSRLGTKNIVASSSKGSLHCEQVRDRIQQKLEAVQFKCVKKS